MEHRKAIYIAGPLFSQSERRYLEYLVDFLTEELNENFSDLQMDKGMNNMVWGICKGEQQIYKINDMKEEKRLLHDLSKALKEGKETKTFLDAAK
jgi:nucleoside 2-deoxyribosyltransferase